MNCKLNVELSPELELYREKIEATIKPYIEIQLTDNDKPTWWQSKFGGLPYLPKDFKYPKSWNGEYLYLLAQINFAEVPHLEGFPDRGILQFYIAADEESYGLDFKNPTEQNKFRVLYFSNIELEENNLVTDFSFLPQLQNKWSLPFEGCCQIEFHLKFAPISPSDYRFDLFPLYEDDYEEIAEEYYDKFTLKHKLGGYPDFTQSDPREIYPQNEEEYILLFQIDSDRSKTIDICWGDVGIANFFIKESALEKLNFSEILYNWDCG